MENVKKILVMGATGAMGKYLIPELARMGYHVDALALDEVSCDFSNVTAITGNAKDFPFLDKLLLNSYDAIVDFMIYPTSQLCYIPYIAARTEHYIYLSSYRIYDNREHPVTENSPRLLDTSDNVMLRNSDDYCIYKARGENIMHALPRKNWTIIRPAITYSLMRYQLVTLEAPDTVGRSFAGKGVVLPEQARNIQGTMSWGGDVARMIARLIFNEKALGETFTVSTAEHHSWGEIADMYKDICNLNAVWVDQEDYLKILGFSPNFGTRWQLEYDRLFDRIIDNSKILAATGMGQGSLMPLYDGLKHEIARCPRDLEWRVLESMDNYLATKGLR